ncbi:catechol 2,3-dioxygenase-like lactoylglutathione lyase family enzyme [Actinoplanes octamycinicus]|uniref:Catechol 2,3-dioxygenase-like lactoylglutathione lyase family enzyme n=1 Tax=Actinoplanes octamycinicus TaxID=135948 RepID=A0A7W7MCP8_9ACTN|nr:VOC family protein [Actinoplanes octamycinicus]MBB4745323.1 catechol 2,3-dioxygenase-like lactoylglutathione lyase family enzyme [Actinoplanes octamycinicus]GIE62197.1 glyoxalase [Actinoplanes octamycinicus]
MSFPRLQSIVLDTPDARGLAEFYRHLLGFTYRPGDEPPAPGEDDEKGRDWLVLVGDGGVRLAFQQEPELKPTTWPDQQIPQQLHLDTSVSSVAELDRQHERALSLGATLRFDRSDDPEEPLRVYADPAGHTFCIFVAS